MLQTDVSLKAFNTFGVDVTTAYYFALSEESQLNKINMFPKPHTILGGGSNILFTQNYQGTIIHNQLKGIMLIEENEDSVTIKASAGEVWHDFIAYTLSNHWYGLEYLALIPGTVGASPVQNIGAYGAEVAQFIQSVSVYDSLSDRLFELKKEECSFSYRNSIFKAHPEWIITSVTFILSKRPKVKENLYPAIIEWLKNEPSFDLNTLTPEKIFQTVIQIRESKLPKVGEIGSAGSFFQNPIVSLNQANQLKKSFPNLVTYPISETLCKLSAGQLIDSLGWKGRYIDNVGMYEKQALILVNLGGATGKSLLEYSHKVASDVLANYDIQLNPEPLII